MRKPWKHSRGFCGARGTNRTLPLRIGFTNIWIGPESAITWPCRPCVIAAKSNPTIISFTRIQKQVSGRLSLGITTTATLPCLPTRTDCTNPISPSFPRPCSLQGGKYPTATSFTRESFVIRSCELPIFVALRVWCPPGSCRVDWPITSRKIRHSCKRTFPGIPTGIHFGVKTLFSHREKG